jgi:hypothetical protein
MMIPVRRRAAFWRAGLVALLVLLGACSDGASTSNDGNSTANNSGNGNNGGNTPPSSPAPTVTLTAMPATVEYNGPSTLSWSSRNATACNASGAWNGAKDLSGTQPLTNLTGTATYTLTCTGSGGSASQSVSVTVNPPPPTAGTTLTTVTLTNRGAAGEVVATFGHAFRVGEVPATATLGARLANNTAVALQVDKKASHADGSLRHAVLTARLPLAAGESASLALYAKAPDSSGTALTFAQLLDGTGFDAAVALTINGAVHRASVRNLYTGGAAVQTWLTGSEVSEWIIRGPIVTNAADITANPALGHLMAYFHIRVYAGLNRVRVDTVVENNWTFRTGGSTVNYTAHVSVGGNTVYSGTLAHAHHSRWHQIGWWGGDPQVTVRHDGQYLRDTRLVPNYARLTLAESLFGRLVQTITPMTNANLTDHWGATGYQPQIGLLPEWDAACIISLDPRACNAVLANASAAGSYGYHYRDENTGYPPSIQTYPRLSEQDSSSGLAGGSGANPYSHDVAHHPSVGFLAYLLTGDYFYLEELQFLANWTELWNNAGYRGNAQGIITGQNRAQAWAIRTLAQAGAITPDAHPLKSYFTTLTENNIAQKTAAWATPATNSLGAIQDYNWNPPSSYYYAPWQNDFFAGVFGYVVDLGYASATTMRNWLARWPTGRMGQDGSGYCWAHAAQYQYGQGIYSYGLSRYYHSFLELYQANFPVESAQPCPASGLMSGYADQPSGYYSNMQPALAYAVDAGVATRATWDKFRAAGTADYRAAPVWAVEPR